MRPDNFRKVGLAALALLIPLSTGGAELPPLPKFDLAGTFPVVERQVRAAEAVVAAHPNDSAANGKLAMVLDAYEQFASAAVCYRRAHLLDPKSFEWMYDLGWVEFKQGHYEEASKTLSEALALGPDCLPAKLKLADSWLAVGRFDAAERLYREVLRQDPASAEALYGLGRAEAAEGDLQAAVASLEKACDRFAPYGMAHYALALVYRKLGETNHAEEHFTFYKAHRTTVPPAVDPLRAAVQQFDESPLALLRRGIDLEKEGDLQGAIREHQKALEMDPHDVQAHINLIQLYARAGEVGKAEQEYQTAVRMNSNRADCYYNYGVMMFQLGKFPEAENAFRRTIEINPYHAEAHYNLGVALEIERKLDAALEEFKKAVADRPDYRQAHFQMGRTLANQQKYPQAIEEFQKTLTPADQNTPTYLYALGATYARAGQAGNALRYLREARDQASARGQSDLLVSINNDLEALEKQTNSH